MLFIILAIVYGIGLAVTFLGYLFSWDYDANPLTALFLAVIWPVVFVFMLVALGHDWLTNRKD